MEDGVSMYFFLPDEVTQNLTLIEEALTAEFVQDLSNSLHTAKVLLTLPVIKLSYKTNLLPALSDLGETKTTFCVLDWFINVLFCFFTFVSLICSPVSGLSEWLAETDLIKITSQPVKLNAVHHKVVMEMAPEGAEYASTKPIVTGLAYRVDRPFLFLVRDEPSGALLFIGKVLNPSDLERV